MEISDLPVLGIKDIAVKKDHSVSCSYREYILVAT